MEMTKSEVRTALGFTLDRQLADFFGVGKAAVSAWAEEVPIPEVRQWQAAALRPDLFDSASIDLYRKAKDVGGVAGRRSPSSRSDLATES